MLMHTLSLPTPPFQTTPWPPRLRDYHQRYKICEYHLKVPSIMRDDKPQRFCQQVRVMLYLQLPRDPSKGCCKDIPRHAARDTYFKGFLRG